MNKKWIIFDMMGVIFKVGDDTNDLLVPYVQSINKDCDRETINEVYLDASLGNITSTRFWEILKAADGSNYLEIEKRYLDTYLIIDEQFIEIAKKLSKDYNLAILSNDVCEWGSYLREKFCLNDFVSISVISGDVRCRKPSKDIYLIALERLGATPQDCVFIDDRDKNLVPAKDLGMQVIKFLRDDINCNIEGVKTISSFGELEEIVHTIW